MGPLGRPKIPLHGREKVPAILPAKLAGDKDQPLGARARGFFSCGLRGFWESTAKKYNKHEPL